MTTPWYVGTPWYEVRGDCVSQYWEVRNRASVVINEWRASGGRTSDGYDGDVYSPVITIGSYFLDKSLTTIADIRVVVPGPPPGACPTLIKMMHEALAIHVAGEVQVGTQPIERAERSVILGYEQ